jgi:hypothetical protein
MPDLSTQLQHALDKAAEYELLGSRAVDAEKREEYRVKAKFYNDIAKELRAELANPPKTIDRMPPTTDAVGSGATTA